MDLKTELRKRKNRQEKERRKKEGESTSSSDSSQNSSPKFDIKRDVTKMRRNMFKSHSIQPESFVKSNDLEKVVQNRNSDALETIKES